MSVNTRRCLSIDLRSFSLDWFSRKKQVDSASVHATKLKRCLGLLELTALGIGATIGSGIYVVAPTAARFEAGPAMVISFLIAAVASVLAGVCYAELGARIPRAGSAYVYSYVVIGELLAFMVGWNMILEYIIGTASVARAAVTYIDVIANGVLTKTFTNYLPIHVSALGGYFDPIAFGLTLVVTALLSIGVQESAMVNNILVTIKVLLLIGIIIAGLVYADPGNWSLTLEQIQNATNTTDTTFGTGGFMPYGFGGVMTAASAAFFSFAGFDCIAATGEEVSNPRRNIPLSIILSLSTCTIVYCAASIMFTMGTPYFNISPGTLLPKVPYGNLVVSIGAILSALTTLVGGMYPLPRIIYAMAQDGLLFPFLMYISPRFKTPLIATLISGLLTAIFSSIFDVEQLVNMMSIGTLMAYSMVSASTLILRYRETFIDTDNSGSIEEMPRNISAHAVHREKYVRALFTFRNDKGPATKFTSKLAIILASMTAIAVLAMVVFVMVFVVYASGSARWWPLVLVGVFAGLAFFLTLRLGLLPQNKNFKTFQVPGVPVVPVLSLTICFYLLVSLDLMTWIRFAVWMTIGLVIYFAYGMWSSKAHYPSSSQEENGEVNEMSPDIPTISNGKLQRGNDGNKDNMAYSSEPEIISSSPINNS